MMWILVFVMFSGPYELNGVDTLGVFISQNECIGELNRAVQIQPHNSSIACIPTKRPTFI